MSTLPPLCYARHPENSRTILIVRGEPGYHPVESTLTPEQLNSVLDEAPTVLQAEAMMIGCMFGWHVPGAATNVLRASDAEACRDQVPAPPGPRAA